MTLFCGIDWAEKHHDIALVTPVPNAPAWLYGLGNLRGQVLSLIDLRAFFEFKDGRWWLTAYVAGD